jgi:hypothetical protein
MLPNQQDKPKPSLSKPQDQLDAMRAVMRMSGMNKPALNAIEAADAISMPPLAASSLL